MYYSGLNPSDASIELLNTIQYEAEIGNLISGTMIKKLALGDHTIVESESNYGLHSSISMATVEMSAVAVGIIGVIFALGFLVKKKGLRTLKMKTGLNYTPSVTIGKKGGLRKQDNLKKPDLDEIKRDVFSSDPFETQDDDIEMKKAQLKKYGLTKTNVAELFLKQGSLSTISEGHETENQSSSSGIPESPMSSYPRILSDSIYSDDVQLSTAESVSFDEGSEMYSSKHGSTILDV